MLERPPDSLLPLTNALANLTGWFDWGALEAIGTVGALWFAVVQSTRTARSERAARIGTLTALIGLTEPINEGVPIFDRTEEGYLHAEEVEYLVSQRDIVQRGIEGLKLIPLPELSAVGATEYVGALSLSLSYLLEQMPKNRTDAVYAPRLNDASSYIPEALEFFCAQRDYIKYGWLLLLVHKARTNLNRRYSLWRYRRRRTAKAQAGKEQAAPVDVTPEA